MQKWIRRWVFRPFLRKIIQINSISVRISQNFLYGVFFVLILLLALRTRLVRILCAVFDILRFPAKNFHLFKFLDFSENKFRKCLNKLKQIFYKNSEFFPFF